MGYACSGDVVDVLDLDLAKAVHVRIWTKTNSHVDVLGLVSYWII